jgi:hypothetical protein
MKSAPLDCLWGAILDHVDLDVVHHVLVLTLRVIDSSKEMVHTLECKNLSDLRFFSAIPAPWKYAEVTEVYANVDEAGRTHVDIVLWSEDAGLVAVADSVELDGERI